ADDYAARAARELDQQLGILRTYLDTVASRRRDFEAWIAELRRRAGPHADQIPPPPELPEPPAALAQLLATGPVLPKPEPPAVSLPPLPPLPKPPVLDLPLVELPSPPPLPGTLGVDERNVSGGPSSINTFDQNVPGFSVTFLLLGMLLGGSLGRLDARDWGTLERLRAMPVGLGRVLGAKLLSRFLVGFLQMVVLFAVGRLFFGISLGREPWLLLLPTAGIVFAGTAFGLVVAALATTRGGVVRVGSIVIVTMAAVGGCWWPIDLEPHWMRRVALAFPTTWAMEAYNDLMIRRRGLEAALRPAAVMAGFGLLYLVTGALLFRRRGHAREGSRASPRHGRGSTRPSPPQNRARSIALPPAIRPRYWPALRPSNGTQNERTLRQLAVAFDDVGRSAFRRARLLRSGTRGPEGATGQFWCHFFLDTALSSHATQARPT